MTRRFHVLVGLVLALGGLVSAQSEPNLATLGPAIGTPAPDFSGLDQSGRTQTLRSILGPEGAMLVFFRSADW